jgi:hypothetical protein
MYKKNDFILEKIISSGHKAVLPWRANPAVDITASDNSIAGYDLVALNIGLGALRQNAHFYIPDYYNGLTSMGLNILPTSDFRGGAIVTALLDINTETIDLTTWEAEPRLSAKKYLIATEYSHLLDNSQYGMIFFLTGPRLIYFIRNYLKFHGSLKSLDDFFNVLTLNKSVHNNIIFYFTDHLICMKDQMLYYSHVPTENIYFILSLIIWMFNLEQDFKLSDIVGEASFIEKTFSGINEKSMKLYIQHLLAQM